MSLAPETIVDGKYRVIRTLGEGGVGVVYVAEHTFLKKHFALKILRAEMAAYPEVAARFEQEARAASLIEHDNIVRVTDFGRTAKGELYLVMELLDGRPLSDELYVTAKLGRNRTIWIARQVLLALEAAHARNIIHRDLKPENVLIVRRGDGSEILKLVDFGLAKLRDDPSVRLTMTGTVLGTPQYMAPEQARGVADLDQRVDLHALGVMMYECLAGQPPYQGDNYNLVLYEILNGRPPQLTTVAPEVDPALASIVMRAFHPDREQRYQSAGELRKTLEQYSAGNYAGPPAVDALASSGPMLRPAAPPSPGSAPAPADFPGSSSGLAPRVSTETLSPANVDRLPRKAPEPPPPIASAFVTPAKGVPALDLATPLTTAQARGVSPPFGTPAPAAPGVVPEKIELVPIGGAPPVDEAAVGLELDKPAEVAPEAPAPAPSFAPPKEESEEKELLLEAVPGRGAMPGALPRTTQFLGQMPSAVLRPEPEPPPEPPPRKDRRPLLAGALVVLVALGGLYLWEPWVKPPPPPPVPMLTVTIEGLPSEAVYSLDGIRRFYNPIPDLPADGKDHVLKIECEGYQTKVVHLKATSNQVIDGHLEKRR